jgi:acyl-CoA synthetase (AMP-forming)/AMP-acid ligase II
VAAVVARPGETIEPDELKLWANGHVDAKFQRLSDVLILNTLPRNVAGKILKREMRDSYGRRRGS